MTTSPNDPLSAAHADPMPQKRAATPAATSDAARADAADPRAAQQAAAIRMRAAGATYRRIGEVLGVNNTTVMRWIRGALAAHPADPIEAAVRDFRREAHGVLDRVVDANLDLAANPGNGNLLVRSVEVRARLEGLIAAPVPQPVAGRPVWSGRMLVAHDNGITIDAATGDVLAPRKGDHRMSEQFDIVIDPVLIIPPTMLVGDTPEIYNERCRHSVQWKHYRLDQRVNHDWSTPFDPEQWPGEPAEPPGGAVTRLVAPWRGSSPPPRRTDKRESCGATFPGL